MAATKASAARNTRTKKKERKNIAAGTAHIQSTFNNTIVTITDTQGNTVSWCSTGAVPARALLMLLSLPLKPLQRLQWNTA